MNTAALIEKWENIGRQAALTDTFMANPKIIPKDIEYAVALWGRKVDAQDVLALFEDRWEDTGHFRALYGRRIDEEAETAAIKARISPEDPRYWDYVSHVRQDLYQAFWRGFHQTFNTYDRISRQMARWGLL